MATILVVDDSAVDRDVAGRCVKDVGLIPIYAENGAEALTLIESDAPDIVLTDLQMPEMDGLELVNAIQKSHPEVPVILMTAFGSEQVAMTALKAGAASYVPKNMLNQELRNALRTVQQSIEARKYGEQVRGLLERSESHFVLDYDPAASIALVSFLQSELHYLNFCDEPTLFQVTTALSEALANAIEHGNLEVSSTLREKQDGSYYGLCEERIKQKPYSERRVYVTAKVTPDEATYVVRDDGSGFDISELPNTNDPESVLRPSGRGVMLINTFMDEVTFNEAGNEITMTKRRTTS